MVEMMCVDIFVLMVENRNIDFDFDFFLFSNFFG